MYDQTRAQFGRATEGYSQSPLFAQGEDLAWLLAAAEPSRGARALDVGTAAGHTAFALAPHVGEVIGLDITPEMIDMARRNAAERRVPCFRGVVANAEQIPFSDDTFDIVACRYTAHHFRDLHRAMAEVARVLRPGGRLVVVDNTAPDDPELDRWINHVEKLRDPSHVKEWTRGEWQQAFAGARLSCEILREWMLPLEFGDWTARQQVPPEQVAALQSLFDGAAANVRQAFGIDGTSFSLLTRLMRGRKPGALRGAHGADPG